MLIRDFYFLLHILLFSLFRNYLLISCHYCFFLIWIIKRNRSQMYPYINWIIVSRGKDWASVFFKAQRWFWCTARTGTEENSLAALHNIKDRITIWSSNSTSRYMPQRIESRHSNRYLYTHVHNSVIHNSQRVEKIKVSTDGWTDKQNMVKDTMKYYSALNEILTSATMWINLTDIH